MEIWGYTHHMHNEKHMHDAFLAPQSYLCSTSLRILAIHGAKTILPWYILLEYFADFSKTVWL